MVCVVELTINMLPMGRKFGLPWPQYLTRRKNSARDVLLMILECLNANSEAKDLHARFGAVNTSFIEHVELGTSAFTHSLFGHKLSRVKWDRSDEGLMLASNLTK